MLFELLKRARCKYSFMLVEAYGDILFPRIAVHVNT